jgi:hypothetical protein
MRRGWWEAHSVVLALAFIEIFDHLFLGVVLWWKLETMVNVLFFILDSCFEYRFNLTMRESRIDIVPQLSLIEFEWVENVLRSVYQTSLYLIPEVA